MVQKGAPMFERHRAVFTPF